MLREWVSTAVKEIINLYTIDPMTLYGTINIGPDITEYRGLQQYASESQLDEFSLMYKALAVNIYHAMGAKLDKYITNIIDSGYTDVTCSVVHHATGLAIISVHPFTRTDHSDLFESNKNGPI